MALRPRSNFWIKNKLLKTFLSSKRKQNKRNIRSQPQAQVAKRFKPTFSLLPDPNGADQVGEQAQHVHSPEPDRDPDWTDGGCDGEDSGNEETKQHRRSHASMRAKQLEAWTKVQTDLVQCYAIDQGIKVGQLCMECSNTAQFRCRDCSASAFYCKNCCVRAHGYNNLYHFPEKWVDGRFILAPLKSVVPLTHNCSATYQRKITVISTQGETVSLLTLF